MKLPFVSRKALEQTRNQLDSLRQDFQNYRRRNADLEQTARLSGTADAVKALLPVYDNLLRALENPCGDEAFRKGVSMTMTEMKKSLSALGVEEIPALGLPFDPELHEAMEHIADPDCGEAQVARVVLTGFRLGNQVLRPALVAVAN